MDSYEVEVFLTNQTLYSQGQVGDNRLNVRETNCIFLSRCIGSCRSTIAINNSHCYVSTHRRISNVCGSIILRRVKISRASWVEYWWHGVRRIILGIVRGNRRRVRYCALISQACNKLL